MKIKYKKLISEWEQSIFATKLNSYTKQIYKNQILLFFKEFKELDKEALLKFLTTGQRNRNYIRKYAIKSFVNFLVMKKYPDSNKLLRIVNSIKYTLHDRKNLNTLEYKDVIMLLQRGDLSDELKLLVMLAFDSAARIRALLQLRYNDIKIFRNAPSIILHEKREKTIVRQITMNTYNNVKSFFSKSKYKYPFIKRNSKPTITVLNKFYYKYWKELKNKSRKLFGVGVSFHWIRRGTGVYWFDKLNHNLVAVQSLYRHTNPQVTARYLMLSALEVEKMMKNEKRPW